jgi:hypothetical protein
MDECRLKVRVLDEGRPTHARAHLTDSNGLVVYAPGCLAYDRDWHFTFDGGFSCDLPPGRATLIIEKGKEYLRVTDVLNIPNGGEVRREYEVERWIDMNSMGWYSGDTHVHRMPENMPHLLEAEDLNLAPILSTWNQRDVFENPNSGRVVRNGLRAYSLVNQEDERKAGAIMALNLETPVRIETESWYPSQAYFAEEWRKQGAIAEQEKPFWWEAPVNVAMGLVDTVGIINNHLQRTEVMENEAWGHPRDMDRYPGAMGFVNNVLDLYYRYLNLGIKLPITAGSASGVLRNPLGYNRLYVKLEDGFTYEGWFEGMKTGRAFATNGPMLFFTVDGELPGLTKQLEGSAEISLGIRVECPRELRSLEVVRNGEVVREFPIQSSQQIEFKIDIDESCWAVVRVFEECEETVRFAHSNPLFLETPDPLAPSADDANYYMKWCQELLKASREDPKRYSSKGKRSEVEDRYARAVEFYRCMTV